jgi:hypothetical protein
MTAPPLYVHVFQRLLAGRALVSQIHLPCSGIHAKGVAFVRAVRPAEIVVDVADKREKERERKTGKESERTQSNA